MRQYFFYTYCEIQKIVLVVFSRGREIGQELKISNINKPQGVEWYFTFWDDSVWITVHLYFYPQELLHCSFHQVTIWGKTRKFLTGSISPVLYQNLNILFRWEALQNISCTTPHWYLVGHRFSVTFQESLKIDFCMQVHIHCQKPLKNIFENAIVIF